MRRSSIVCGFTLALSACGAGGPYPLLDGVCDEYEALKAETHALGDRVTLNVFQDASTVWFCAGLPEGSYGTLDLLVEAPGLDAPINLHVSAQLGEWAAGDEGAAPDSATSDKWWQVSGWTAFPARMNGMIERADGRRPNYLPSPGRELALSKARFGKGEWRLRFVLNAIRNEDGEFTVVFFPVEEAERFSLKAK